MQKARALELLGAYTPVDAREARYRERMLELLGGERPFSRTEFEPGHFTASAIVLSPERDAALLIFHAKLGLWLQPGGHVDAADADLFEAARREVREEVGISELDGGGRGILDLDVHSIPGFASEPAHEHFDVRFLLVARSRAFEKSDEVRAARWVPLPVIESVTRDASVLRAVDKVKSLG
jgi:8-oxo-dGTP pyrophosphatase MutT (NUDIX family)